MERHRNNFLPIQGSYIPLYGSFGAAADGGAVSDVSRLVQRAHGGVLERVKETVDCRGLVSRLVSVDWVTLTAQKR